MPRDYTDLCVSCQASLKDQFLDGLRGSLKGFIATASLADIVRDDRHVQLVARVNLDKGTVYYEILDYYKVFERSFDYGYILGVYEQYVRDFV